VAIKKLNTDSYIFPLLVLACNILENSKEKGNDVDMYFTVTAQEDGMWETV
jgi:hypothetical protein